MTRADYQRQPSANAVLYTIQPIPTSKARVVGSGPVMLAAQTFFIALLGLIPAAMVGALLSSFFGVLVAVAIPVYFVVWMRRRSARLLGRRRPSQVTVNENTVQVSTGGAQTEVPRDAIRRLVIGNTYDEHLEAQPALVAVNPGAGQAAGAAIRANIDRKQPAVCFALSLHHGNDQTLLADGLDELTAHNLADDLGRDLNLG